jgi:hypothetical protein
MMIKKSLGTRGWGGGSIVYQPALRPDQMHSLYLLKQASRVPMTRLAQEAAEDPLAALPEPAAAVQDVGVDQRGLEAAVAEEFLDRPNVVAVGQQVGGEAVAQAVERRRLGDFRSRGRGRGWRTRRVGSRVGGRGDRPLVA